MEEREPYQLICSYVKRKYFISTAYRKASTIEPMWYYETMVWPWDDTTHKRGETILEMEDSGISENHAMKRHFEIANDYMKKIL